jgi:hypothetical protein
LVASSARRHTEDYAFCVEAFSASTPSIVSTRSSNSTGFAM